MKIEIGEKRPAHFVEYWPGQYQVFSHFEYACGIPSVLHAVTTLKENGLPNLCFNAWASFAGDGKGFFAVLPSIMPHTHTYQNIRRTGEFVVNFVGPAGFDGCIAAIARNGPEVDEVAAGGFTAEAAKTVAAPRLAEAFLCLECTLEKAVPLGEDSGMSILVGRVRHIAAQAGYAKGLDRKYSGEGFMLNIHAPKNLTTGEGKPSAVAVCKIVRVNEDG